MTDLLLKLFVPNHENQEDAAVRGRIGTLSGLTGIVCNLLLFLGKLIVGTVSGSVSITADALNNLSDASGSILTLVGFRLAGKPADEEHPYGHARFEYLSGLAVAVLILFIGFELGKSSLEKIIHPTAVEFSAVAAGVLVASILVKLWMFVFNRRLGNHIDSTTLMATAIDSRNDCITTAAVLGAALLERYANIRVDGVAGLAVAVFILHSGLNLARDTINPILGEGANPELRRQLVDYIQSCPKVLGYHDLMVHDYGPGQRFASLHVEMDAREDPLACHELIDDMERECYVNHKVQLVIHYDPVVTDDPELTRMKEKAKVALKTIDDRLTLHDFRMVQGKGHTNLIFDVALPSDLRSRSEAILQELTERINDGEDKTYYLVITFDSTAFNQ